jgi:hypothetical protein
MVRIFLLVILVAALLLFALPGCESAPIVKMRLYVENQTGQSLVVVINGISFGEIPPNGKTPSLYFEKFRDAQVLVAFNSRGEEVINKTYGNDEFIKVSYDEETVLEQYKLVITPLDINE